jgi:hypothetical protein
MVDSKRATTLKQGDGTTLDSLVDKEDKETIVHWINTYYTLVEVAGCLFFKVL